MKTLLTILITLGFISFAKAQNSISRKIFDEDIKFGIPDSSLKYRLSDFTPGVPPNDSGLSYILPAPEFQLKENDNFLYGNNYNAEFKMLVAGAHFNSNMPVVKSDSTVDYLLKIKEIPFVNPLYKNQGIRLEDIE